MCVEAKNMYVEAKITTIFRGGDVTKKRETMGKSMEGSYMK